MEFYSNYGIALMALAGSMNVPFLPTRSMIGSSIAEQNPRIRVIDDPYGGGTPVALVPAAGRTCASSMCTGPTNWGIYSSSGISGTRTSSCAARNM